MLINDFKKYNTAIFSTPELPYNEDFYQKYVKSIRPAQVQIGAASPIPTLIAPENLAENVFLIPEFQWSHVDDFEFYILEIATDEEFEDIVFTSDELLTNSYTLEFSLGAMQTYYWRVRTAVSGFSSPFRFVTALILMVNNNFTVKTEETLQIEDYKEDLELAHESEGTGFSTENIDEELQTESEAHSFDREDAEEEITIESEIFDDGAP